MKIMNSAMALVLAASFVTFSESSRAQSMGSSGTASASVTVGIAAMIAIGGSLIGSATHASLSPEARAQGMAQVREVESLIGTQKTREVSIAMATGMDPDSDAIKHLDQAGEIGAKLKKQYTALYEKSLNIAK